MALGDFDPVVLTFHSDNSIDKQLLYCVRPAAAAKYRFSIEPRRRAPGHNGRGRVRLIALRATQERWRASRGDRVMAKHIEDLSQFLQSFGVAPLTLLFLPVLITALARNATLALATSLLSFASLMFFVAPASAISGLAIVSGLGSFLVALESILARGRMKEIADLSGRVNELERAEQRRLSLEIKAAHRSRATSLRRT